MPIYENLGGTYPSLASPHLDPMRNMPRWAPPAQANPTVYTANNSFLSITAGINEDVIVYGRPSLSNGAGVQVQGGRHVRFIGGKYAKSSAGTTLNVGQVTGSISFEGVELDASGYNGDAINACGITTAGQQTFPDVYIQKCRITGANGTTGTVHADCFQPQGPMGRLFVDLCTFSSDYQGFFISPQAALSGAYFSRCNFTKLVNATNPITYMLWFNDGTQNPYPVILDEVYVTGPAGQSLASNWIWPNAGLTGSGGSINGVAVGAVDNGDGSASWPQAMQIDGKVYSGAPPAGDFVPAGLGIAYTSKNFLASPPPVAASLNGRLLKWGVQAEAYPVALASNNTVLTSGRMEAALIAVTPGQVLTGIVVALNQNSVTLTNLYAYLYNTDTANTLLTLSPNNQPTALDSGSATTGNLIKIPFFASGTFTIPAGCYAVYAGILAKLTAGTMPGLGRAAATGWVNGVNGGLPLFVMNTGNTTPPSPTIGAGNWNQENTSYWIGVY